MARQKQNGLPGFEQEKIEDIEHWADVFDEKRALIEGLKDELSNAEFKLKEAMHANEAKVDRQVKAGKEGGKVLVYNKNGYKVKVKEKGEAVNVKISDKQKGTAPEGE